MSDDLYAKIFEAMLHVLGNEGVDLETGEFSIKFYNRFHNWLTNPNSVLNMAKSPEALGKMRDTFSKIGREDAFFDMHEEMERSANAGLVAISFAVEGVYDHENSGLQGGALIEARGLANSDQAEKGRALVEAVQNLLISEGFNGIHVQHNNYGKDVFTPQKLMHWGWGKRAAGIDPPPEFGW